MFILKQGNIIVKTSENNDELLELQKIVPNSNIEETDITYIYNNGRYVTPEEISKEEEDKINRLTMTALDLVTYIRKAGATTEEIVSYLNTNPEVYLQLTLCQNVFCGVVRQLAPIKVNDNLTITDNDIVMIFKDKNQL